ncbi:MAG: hypothetical protein EBR82_54880 [Caulobacteraceae bacterium]|nr:hypothetical protein [Caulobacteraceae bacterium]
MKDIVNELRDRSYSFKARDPLCERAADEIERLRAPLRDHFAAAALTGIMAHDGDASSLSNTCAYAYRIADAMLRERAKNNAGPIVPSRDTASDVTSPPVAAPAGINRNAASQSPDVSVGGGEPLDVPQADNSRAAGGRGHNIPDSRTRGRVGTILSEAEIDALEYVVVEGRIACVEDYGILRSLLVRVRPEWENA